MSHGRADRASTVLSRRADRGRVADVFLRASDLPIAARAAFLDVECGEDEDLRREVESLLAVDSEATRPDTNRADVERAQTEIAGEPHSGERPAAEGPERIGRFTIRRRIGEGGMGVVLAGWDETLGREVAVKVVHPARGGGAARARLLREAQAMARVAHPNVCAVYEAGLHEDGVFVAMEFVVGGTLSAWLKREPRTARQILEMYVQAGRGLAAAHEAGILHRDFKPQNVLVGTDGRARVVDFGLARAATGNSGNRDGATGGSEGLGRALVTELTVRGAIMGTPGYMSPEHFRGTTTAASDQWSFGVALYRALFGVAPFTGETFFATMEAIVAGPAPAPPQGPADLPPRTTSIVLRALSRSPDERWPSVAAMVEALEAELAFDPSKDPTRYRKQQRRAAAIMAVGAVLNGLAVAVHDGPLADAPLAIVLHSAVGLTALGVATFAFRHSLLRTPHSRNLLAYLGALIGAMTAHRAVAFADGTSALVTLRADAIFSFGFALLGMLLLERWLAWLGAAMAIYLASTYVVPAAAVPAFGFAMISTLAVGVWSWRDRR